MPKIVVVEKTGELREINLKTYSEEELYKKAGFKSADGFEFQTNWEVELGDSNKKSVCLYAKTKGRAGQENKYDFPPPIDSKLYYGSCVLVNTIDGKVAGDITVEEWTKMYEALFGGFEDIGSDSEKSCDEEEESDLPKTKAGYVKDGFVVDSDDEPPKKPAKKTKKSSKKTVFDQIGNGDDKESNGILCKDELEEDEYL